MKATKKPLRCKAEKAIHDFRTGNVAPITYLGFMKVHLRHLLEEHTHGYDTHFLKPLKIVKNYSP